MALCACRMEIGMADNKEFTSVNKIEKTGQVILDNNKDGAKIQLITIIGEVEGLNTVGGDVSAGLALAEMISSLSKPTVSLVLGDSHSIGVPLAVACDYSFITPTGTMIIHPVRMSGTVIGAPQTYDYFKLIQDRIAGFIERHTECSREQIEQMMMNTGILTKDLGTILVGEEAVDKKLICEVGGISNAIIKLRSMCGKA